MLDVKPYLLSTVSNVFLIVHFDGKMLRYWGF